jgi:hypothetical protein
LKINVGVVNPGHRAQVFFLWGFPIVANNIVPLFKSISVLFHLFVFGPALEAIPDFVETKIEVLANASNKFVFTGVELSPPVVNVGHGSFVFLSYDCSFWLSAILYFFALLNDFFFF